MATRSNHPFDESMLARHEATAEKAPSVMVQDRQSVAQIAAFVGVFLAIVGSLSLFLPRDKFSYVIPAGWGFALLTLGTALMLYHCFADPEYQFRRLYGGFAMLMGIVGCGACLIPTASERFGPYWLTVGVPLLTLSPLFAVGVLRHEDDERSWRTLVQNYLGAMFVVLVAGGIVGMVRNPQFIAAGGFAFFLLAAIYTSGYIGSQPTDSDRGYNAGLALGATAVLFVAGGVIASLAISQYFVPNGLTLIGVGLLMGMISLGTCSDSAFVVLTRRELAAYFYSPIAYFVMIALLAVFALNFWVWSALVVGEQRQGRPLLDPIVRSYMFIPSFTMIVFIPIVTMRLFSEEKRSGSLEVLLSAPLRESTIVASKFTASLLFSVIVWLPAFLFLIGLRVINQVEFDYRPVLSFALALLATMTNFLAMGLLCSALTNNQIVAAVLAFTGMLIQTLFWIYDSIFTPGTNAYIIFQYLSYRDLWGDSLLGNVAPRLLLLHVSIGAFFLFLTVQVLNARKRQ